MSEPTPSRTLVTTGPQPSALPPEQDLVTLYLSRFDRKNTRRSYRNDLTQFFEADPVPYELAQGVTFVDVNRHIAELEAAGARASTIKRRVAALRGFFDWLIALGAIERNPADKHLLRRVRSVRMKDRPIHYLDATQAARLLEAADDGSVCAVRDQALIYTLLHCVLRRSEAAGMDVEHLRPLGRYWVLDLPDTKGGADQFVKVPESVVERIRGVQDAYGFSSGPVWRSLSNRNRGRRLTPHSIYAIVKKRAKEASLSENIGAHTLRHTGCTLAIEAGASLQQVQAHARHKNIETTMAYVHQRDRLRDSAADYIHLESDAKTRTPGV